MTGDTKLLAVLIDADNTSPKYAKAIFDETSGFGEASVRRCYGDFSSSRMNGWSERIASFALVPHHQPANTVGKNASDIALVKDTGRLPAGLQAVYFRREPHGRWQGGNRIPETRRQNRN